MEGVVADTAVGDLAQGRGVDHPTHGVCLGEAGIVEHDHQNVRCIARQVVGLFAPLVARPLEGWRGNAGRGFGGEGQAALGRRDRTGQQHADIEGEAPWQGPRLAHGYLHVLF
ncbi:hypothetical protein D9M68_831380 [compost metagenome]